MGKRQIISSDNMCQLVRTLKPVIAFIFFQGRVESSRIPTHVAIPHHSKISHGCLASSTMCNHHGEKALEKSAK